MSNCGPVQNCHQKYPEDCSDSGNTIQKVYMNISCDNDKNDNRQEGFGYHDKVEFKYDEITPPIDTLISVNTPVLQVDFSTINPGDRVWLSGVVHLSNDSGNATARVTITITRSSPLSGTPVTIYSSRFRIDNTSGDDSVLEPFSHVDVPNTQLFDVRYQVLLSVSDPNPNLIIENIGPNTLTAIRFIR
ncbi:hypothetical protein CPJCM30710_26290 [Clostridium polyendosporum]|uniref:Uncharacterized protein n=1 Tax=Clostridium polyendosporum TaxID=69208 RepID=A0A919S3J6_9CLOT|nr:hypothetical protein [Clostridium polyendosporum]GIM29963.1 hypothetical protein CPJCM30710_26290 [Clostridium polyendosporum]